MNKKREAELAKLRRDLEEANLNHETQLGALRKKHTDAVAELSDQLDQLQKARAKIEKDKVQLQREAEDLQAQLDGEASGRMNSDKIVKQLELQLGELQTKCDEQGRQLMVSSKVRNDAYLYATIVGLHVHEGPPPQREQRSRSPTRGG